MSLAHMIITWVLGEGVAKSNGAESRQDLEQAHVIPSLIHRCYLAKSECVYVVLVELGRSS